MTRARDVADTQDNVGGSVPPSVAGKNYLINGNFDFFQRTSFASQTSNGYAFDRWYGGVGGTVTLTQQTTGVPQGSQFCGRVAYNAANSFCNLYQALESALVTTLIGRTITVSVKVRRNASFAANLTLGLDWGNTANTLTGGSWTEFATSTLTNAAIPTGTTSSDWTTISVTATVPTNALGLRVHIYENAVGSSGAYWEVAQVQLELGNVATPFSRAGGTIQGELAACQRYYEKSYDYDTAPATVNASNYMFGKVSSNTVANGERYGWFSYQVAKRVAPTLTIRPFQTPTNTGRVSNTGGSDLGANSGTTISGGWKGFGLYNNSGGTLTTTDLGVIFHYEANAEL